MIVLGISEEHDAGAAIIKDGKILAAVNEERLNRKKLYCGFPKLSLKEILSLTNIKPSQINRVAISSYTHIPEHPLHLGKPTIFEKILMFFSEIGLAKWMVGTVWGAEFFTFLSSILQFTRRVRIKRIIFELGIKAPIEYIDHHTGHLYSAYATSDWKKCLVVSIDGAGDGYSAKVGLGENGEVKIVDKIPFHHSPAYYYLYITHILGWKLGREGKVTGLAAFGDFKKTLPIFQKRIIFDHQTGHFKNLGRYLFSEIKVLRRELSGFSKEDIAAGIQKHTEDLVLAYFKHLFKKFKIKKTKLALAGGIFANVKLNQRISELPEVEEIFIHPHMGDGGLTVGAAMTMAYQEGKKQGKPLIPYRLPNLYLGRGYPDKEILAAIKKSDLPYKKSSNLAREVARFLTEGKVVARFSGKMEYGPRALGNRSILYQPTDATVNDWLNKRLKRTEFMPFAPVILEENITSYFPNWKKARYVLEFMTITLNANEKCKKKAPAIVHIDGTARPQVITQEINPVYYDILKAYYKLTGLPLMINTSFNMHEEPIVDSPQTALLSFIDSKLDVLAIEDYLVFQKKE